ncbi:hypothetical protein [Streptococcus mutans]|uniref:hypothetical protein n=2 Tax=Streptococcus mutans TaxID=1309 RepID=UPI001454EA58
MKKRFIVGGFVLFIGLMTLLTGCQDKRNSREWLENRFGTELSRVYPTKDLNDLFKEFPHGFKIEQNYLKGKYAITMELTGDATNNSISGTLTQTVRKTNKNITIIRVNYKNGDFIFSDETKAKQLWPYNGFLFQKLTVNKQFLSQQDMISKYYLSENGDFEIQYKLNNSIIQNYLRLHQKKDFNLVFGGSNSNTGYYYSISIEDNEDITIFNFGEIISDTKN